MGTDPKEHCLCKWQVKVPASEERCSSGKMSHKTANDGEITTVNCLMLTTFIEGPFLPCNSWMKCSSKNIFSESLGINMPCWLENPKQQKQHRKIIKSRILAMNRIH